MGNGCFVDDLVSSKKGFSVTRTKSTLGKQNIVHGKL